MPAPPPIPHLRTRAVLLVVAFWTLFGVVCGMQVWLSMLGHHHSLPRVLAYHVLVWWAWIGITFGVARLTRALPVVPPRIHAVGLHLLVAILLSTAHAVWWVLLALVVRPYDAMNTVEFRGPFLYNAVFQLPLEVLLYGVVVLATYAADHYARDRERERQAAQLERLLGEARMHALELQLQPHFVFNTLNAISALVRTGDNQQAVAMIAGLADLLRYALDRSGSGRVTMADEATMVRRYLEIQQLRFPDRLSFDIEVADDALAVRVPVLLLQPLAENAVRHGIAPSAGPGSVRVRACRHLDKLRIELWNSGQHQPGATPGIGLANTRARLRELYGDGASLDLRGSAGGVLASITLPWSDPA